MPKLVAVADTNFYLTCSDSTLRELCRLEHSAQARPMASFLACSELLAHLTDTEAEDYRAYRAAIRRLYLHCYRPDDPIPFRIIADPHGLIAHTLFDRRHPGRFALADRFGFLVERAATATYEDHLVDIALDLYRVKRHRDEVEERFVDSLEALKRQFGLDPGNPSDFAPSHRPTPEAFLSSGQARLIGASAIVINVAAEYGVPLTEAQVTKLATILLPEASAALSLFEDRLQAVLLRGAKPTNQSNFIWDMYFALVSSCHLSEGLVPILVITNDGAIRRASAAGDGTSRVLSPTEYAARLTARN
jgi:hypothetical protein